MRDEDGGGDSDEKESFHSEQKWELLLLILSATDATLQTSLRRVRRENSTATAADDEDDVKDDVLSASKSGVSSPHDTHYDSAGKSVPASFRPVHALVRCLTSPHLGLGNCQQYAVWSVLRTMHQRIPTEFKVRDASDDNRGVFEILAESPACDCRLSSEEVRDIVECLVDADHRSAFL